MTRREKEKFAQEIFALTDDKSSLEWDGHIYTKYPSKYGQGIGHLSCWCFKKKKK